MDTSISQHDDDAVPASARKARLLRQLRIAGVVLLVLLVGLPFVAAGTVYLLWDDIDKGIKNISASAESIEPPELESRVLDLLTRKLKALKTTLEPEPFFIVTPAEMNSYVNYLINTGGFPQSMPIFRVEAAGDLLRLRALWTGSQFAGLMAAWGLAPGSTLWGPLEQYIQQLPHMQFDAWIRPRVERGLLTWSFDHAELDGRWIPTDVVEWIQSKVLVQGTLFQIGPTFRALKEVHMGPQGLMMKWTAPAK